MKVSPQELQLRLAWPLDMKIEWFCKIYSQFMIHNKGKCYISFSAGKDSQVGRHIIEHIHNGAYKHITPQWERLVKYEMPPTVFSNTGMEYPEIVEHSKLFNAEVIKPKMGFTRVISEIGVAIISKEVAQKIKEIRNTKSDTLRHNRLFGNSKGHGKLPEKWKKYIDAPFLISDKCCEILKKEPFRRYSKETGRKVIVFTTVGESSLRKTSYYQHGCNTLDEGKEKCRPYSIFTEADTWEYHDRWKLRFAEVYYDRNVDVKQLDGTIKNVFVEKKKRTGCAFCMFGIHLEDKSKNNRMQLMAISHPKFHDVIINKCGLGIVLNWMGISYTPITECGKQKELFKD